jgi:SAM-dependent methyltransferase
MDIFAPKFSPHTSQLFGSYLGGTNLNLGCGRNTEIGFINIDRVAGPKVDRVVDLEEGKLPQRDGSVDCILASHVLEHITNLIPLMRECHRVLKPGGYLIAIVPHAGSDDAWEDPTHVRAFTENSWMYWDRRLYARDGHHGSYPSPVDFILEIEKIIIVPRADVVEEMKSAGIEDAEAAVRFGHRFLRNVVREVHAILKKVEG